MDKHIRATAWSVTCNLKNVARSTVEDCIVAARSLGWGVEGQLEKGEEGTEHFQLLVRTPQVRFTAVKKAFPTAHIEVARNVKALQQYVTKEDTRVESLKKIECAFVTYPMARKQFVEWLLDNYDAESLFMSHEQRLEVWDKFIGLSIEEGMEVDLIGMNPQNRACVAKYWFSYIARGSSLRQTEERRQLDRQDTQQVSVPIVT